MALFLFDFFKVYHFYIQILLYFFTKLFYAFEEKLFFSATIILREKVLVSCLKMNKKYPIN